MSDPAAPDFIRYLAAKKGLDDRSLNRQVWDHLVRELRDRPDSAPLRVLEVGCGIGTMLERLLERGLLTRAAYTGIDVEAGCIRAAAERLHGYAAERQASLTDVSGGARLFSPPNQNVRITFEAADLFDFLEREPGKPAWDLLVAHAVLDLIDLDAALPPLLSRLAPGGLFYFSLNFDGATILEPIIDPDLDALIEALYHRTMDTRRDRGRPSGSSRTGRRLFGCLQEAGASLIAAGSSDWVVFPGPHGYPGDEAYFLHFIIDTIGRALHGHPELAGNRFQAWIAQRHRQIEAQELIYIAHQLDFLGYI
ncbi:MAG: class I SAM-dependent methyltransferase [Deltaproteobacteria bacterium]|nr:class I SAM-dependent methyltransferase [Deltaproteobacteria bacterium]